MNLIDAVKHVICKADAINNLIYSEEQYDHFNDAITFRIVACS